MFFRLHLENMCFKTVKNASILSDRNPKNV